MIEPSISSTFEDFSESTPLSGVTFGQATHTGRLREENEDHLGAAPELGFFVVADGVGGAPEGKVASRLATAAMIYSLRAGSPSDDVPDSPQREPRGSPTIHGARLVAAALSAHRTICDYAVKNRCVGAATTMASLLLADGQAHIANTGDSRVYRLCGERLEQLTKDHTAIQEHIDKQGALGQKWIRMMSNVVTQVLGGRSQRTPAVHLVSRPITHREVFLLCTDGLTKMVTEGEIALILAASRSPQQAANALVELANDAGGFDNITVVVVHVEPRPPSSKRGA
jgi:protein phosphatase